jgi:uncharacterized membrane protein YjfL (UPF0719 family)
MADEKKEVSLQDVYDEIKQLRAEGKRQLFFDGSVLGATVVIAGASMWASTLSDYSQRWNAIGIVILGIVFMAWCSKGLMVKKQLKK